MDCHRFAPFHLVPLSSAPADLFSFFPFMSFCLHVSSLARTIVWTLVCTHTRTRTSTYSKVQVAQVRYNEVWLIGCPSSLGSFSSATTHTHLCLSCPFHFHLSLLRAHVPTSFPGRMEVTCLPSGRRVCVTLGVIGILLDLFSFIAGG